MADRPTPCSAAASRSTATWTARRRSACCCPTTPTSTGSTRCGPRCDAILVGAATVRNDNPRLLVRSPDRRDDRVARGLRRRRSRSRVTGAAKLDPGARLLHRPARPRSSSTAPAPRRRTPARSSAPWPPSSTAASRSTCAGQRGSRTTRGVDRLMVEGGGTVHTQFLTADLADELHLVVAPFFVGDSRARRFVSDGRFPWNPTAARDSPKSARSVTSCCCATRSRRDSVPTDGEDRCCRRRLRRSGPR